MKLRVIRKGAAARQRLLFFGKNLIFRRIDIANLTESEYNNHVVCVYAACAGRNRKVGSGRGARRK